MKTAAFKKFLTIAALTAAFVSAPHARADLLTACAAETANLQSQVDNKNAACNELKATLGSKSSAYKTCTGEVKALKAKVAANNKVCKANKKKCAGLAKNAKTAKKASDKTKRDLEKLTSRLNREIEKKGAKNASYDAKMATIQQRKIFAEAQSAIKCGIGIIVGGSPAACDALLRDIVQYEKLQGALRNQRDAYNSKQDGKIGRYQTNIATQQGKITTATAKLDDTLNANAGAMCPAVAI